MIAERFFLNDFRNPNRQLHKWHNRLCHPALKRSSAKGKYFVLVLRVDSLNISEWMKFITFLHKNGISYFPFALEKRFRCFRMLSSWRLERLLLPFHICFQCALNFKRYLLWNICTVLFAVAVYNLCGKCTFPINPNSFQWKGKENINWYAGKYSSCFCACYVVISKCLHSKLYMCTVLRTEWYFFRYDDGFGM